MAFVLKRRRGPAQSVRRAAKEVVDSALVELRSPDRAPAAVVHEVRKRCTEVRALLHLVRGSLPRRNFELENQFYRDLRRRFAEQREIDALAEALARLITAQSDPAGNASATMIQDSLFAARRASVEGRIAPLMSRSAADLEMARKRIGAWPIEDKGYDTVAGGFAGTYRAARRLGRAALAKPSADNLHEWRKEIKYHRHQLRMFRPLWKPVIRDHWRQFSVLCEALGEDHDLTALRLVLHPAAAAGDHSAMARQLCTTIDRRRALLFREISLLGRRLFAETPKAVTGRFGTYFEIWAEHDAPTVLRLVDPPALPRKSTAAGQDGS